MQRIFCYAHQADTVRWLLDEMLGVKFGSVRFSPVFDSVPMRGLEGATFVNVTNHPLQPPSDIFEAIRVFGFITIDLSDQYLRERIGSRRYARTRSAAAT